MKDFKEYLDTIGEVGYLEEIVRCIGYVNGLPGAQPTELVLFESGEKGQVVSLRQQKVEILLFSNTPLKAGMRVVRTNQFLEVPVGSGLLGQTLDPLGNPIDELKTSKKPSSMRPINVTPGGIQTRKRIDSSLETGTTLVDLIIPLGKGQRELIIGDRKTGKTNFVLQTAVAQAQQGSICIYAAIGKRIRDIKKIEEFFTTSGVMKNVVIIATGAEDAPGMIYLTPYSAMTIAEYFRDQGQDVLVVMDDLSTHAKFYREISLLGKKFPGRNSYPGDMFYTHAKLLERAGCFSIKDGKASITCLPIVETSQGNLSGYIQTNLMSMTDGHIYFDSDLFSKGRRPAINPFLSVTRVGRQTQSNMKREINRELISFLTLYEKMQEFIHFGAEVSQSVQHTLSTGERIIAYLGEGEFKVLNGSLQVFLFCLLWIGLWEEKDTSVMLSDMMKISIAYGSNKTLAELVNKLISEALSFNGLLGAIRQKQDQILQEAGLAVTPPPNTPTTTEMLKNTIVKPGE